MADCRQREVIQRSVRVSVDVDWSVRGNLMTVRDTEGSMKASQEGMGGGHREITDDKIGGSWKSHGAQ